MAETSENLTVLAEKVLKYNQPISTSFITKLNKTEYNF